jgi:dCMP deaminase
MNDLDYLKLACLYAQEFSTDPSTQNGALLLAEDGSTCQGANHFPFNVKESAERWERPLKYSFVEHAERNAIYTAARQGIKTAGSTLYCPWFACADCARAIIQAGIKKVVGFPRNGKDTASHWFETIKIGDQMLKEAEVETIFIDDKVNVQLRRNEKIITI